MDNGQSMWKSKILTHNLQQPAQEANTLFIVIAMKPKNNPCSHGPETSKT